MPTSSHAVPTNREAAHVQRIRHPARRCAKDPASNSAMPFDTRATSSGGLMIGAESVTLDDGVAALELLQERSDWTHVIIDVSASDSPFVLPRSEELDDLHLLVRTLRDLRLGRGFQIAIVNGPRSAARVADFVDLARSIAVDLDVQVFDGTAEAFAWVGATLPTD